MKKYLLCPGDICSPHDGQSHFISAAKLASLYKVHLSECVIFGHRSSQAFKTKGLIVLTPRANGDYSLPLPSGEVK